MRKYLQYHRIISTLIKLGKKEKDISKLNDINLRISRVDKIWLKTY